MEERVKDEVIGKSESDNFVEDQNLTKVGL